MLNSGEKYKKRTYNEFTKIDTFKKMTHEEIGTVYYDYMYDRKIYTLPGITIKRACALMNITTDQLMLFLKEEYDTEPNFRGIVRTFRFEDVMTMCNNGSNLSVAKMTRKVGYRTSFFFLYNFWRHLKSEVTVWKFCRVKG